MFSLESFYNLISKNLLVPVEMGYFCFDKFGSIDASDLKHCYSSSISHYNFVFFYDQEPCYRSTYDKLCNDSSDLNNENTVFFNRCNKNLKKLNILANSEHSEEKNNIIKNYNYRDWYYFYHGFAALDWYRNIQHQPPGRAFTKVFITFNNLCTEKRSYRLNLVARLLEKNLHPQGAISLNYNNNDQLKQELFSSTSQLSTESKKIVFDQLYNKNPTLVIDTDNFRGSLSADDNVDVLSQGLFHLVTETIFYDEKLHLTEKIFKPIVARRPFFLVAALGNLAYLKTYGFRTFDQWIDESYDYEPDPDQRIIKIVAEVERLCQLPVDELNQIYQEMQDTLEYNFDWFYGGFKKVIVNELVDNFKGCVDQHNSTPAYSNNYINLNNIDFDSVKKRLAQ
jgi:hypothetical protein